MADLNGVFKKVDRVEKNLGRSSRKKSLFKSTENVRNVEAELRDLKIEMREEAQRTAAEAEQKRAEKEEEQANSSSIDNIKCKFLFIILIYY